MDFFPVEINVSHVCAYWRNVALATPFLWTQIYVYSNPDLDRVATYQKCYPSPLAPAFYPWTCLASVI